MGNYLPSTASERQEMLASLGLTSAEQLFDALPTGMKLDALQLPAGMSEMTLVQHITELAAQNKCYSTILRGAGAYDHYIPAIVKRMTSKEEFVTAYTPYQAEISQGLLQGIFEYQTMICDLTDMEVANASVYDGASAAAEAIAMCVERKRTKMLISASAHPHTIQVMQTYCMGSGVVLEIIPTADGITDVKALAAALSPEVAGVYVAQPNYLGLIEPCAEIGAVAKAAGAKFVMGVNPIACALLKTPGECGADIAVGEGQPLGMPLSFGGPYLGFMATKTAMARKLPGRIVGQTKDDKGNRAFVLTLQAREQHIRREKASSNICSNQALCALTAGVYLGAMGQQGLAEVAQQCHDKAHYLAGALCALSGVSMLYDAPFFHEFVIASQADTAALLAVLDAQGILGGLPVEGGILWCTTEQADKASLDAVVAAYQEVLGL
ncbi:MAG: aminomethyl-transferring glycine dehydrogenase subunit GcvPA [Faecalibacterium sp.]